MRDIVVTQNSASDMRGQTDEEVIKRMIAIADSQFQEGLLYTLKKAGKIAKNYQIPAARRNNTQNVLASWLAPHRVVLLPDFPFGTDFNAIGQVLLPALSGFGDAVGSKRQIAMLIWASLTLSARPQEAAAMQRMGYTADVRLFEPLQSRVLRGALSKEAKNRNYTRLARFMRNSRQSEIAACHAGWYQCSCCASFIKYSIFKGTQ